MFENFKSSTTFLLFLQIQIMFSLYFFFSTEICVSFVTQVALFSIQRVRLNKIRFDLDFAFYLLVKSYVSNYKRHWKKLNIWIFFNMVLTLKNNLW